MPNKTFENAGSRYIRQSVLPVIGPGGQAALARSAVLVVGCGALGSAQSELLARAGVGRIILVDRDVLEMHNLHRQLLFNEQDVRERMPKAAAAARRLRSINSEIVIEAEVADVTSTNVGDFMHSADITIDGTDNFETRYLLNDEAVRSGKPWVYGGVLGTEGSVMAVRPGQGPCLRCIFPDPPNAHLLPTCETQGVLNAAVVWVAALQVAEALKVLVGESATDFKLTALDVWQGMTQTVVVRRNETCVCCSEKRFEFLSGERGSSSSVFCGRNAVQITPEKPAKPSFADLRQRLEPLGKVTMNGLVLEFACEDRRLIVFPDGRVLVMGTTDPAEARTLVAKYIGS